MYDIYATNSVSQALLATLCNKSTCYIPCTRVCMYVCAYVYVCVVCLCSFVCVFVYVQYILSWLVLPFLQTGKERFLILSEGCLYYFVNDKATKQKGAFSIAGYR